MVRQMVQRNGAGSHRKSAKQNRVREKREFNKLLNGVLQKAGSNDRPFFWVCFFGGCMLSVISRGLVGVREGRGVSGLVDSLLLEKALAVLKGVVLEEERGWGVERNVQSGMLALKEQVICAEGRVRGLLQKKGRLERLLSIHRGSQDRAFLALCHQGVEQVLPVLKEIDERILDDESKRRGVLMRQSSLVKHRDALNARSVQLDWGLGDWGRSLSIDVGGGG